MLIFFLKNCIESVWTIPGIWGVPTSLIFVLETFRTISKIQAKVRSLRIAYIVRNWLIDKPNVRDPFVQIFKALIYVHPHTFTNETTKFALSNISMKPKTRVQNVWSPKMCSRSALDQTPGVAKVDIRSAPASRAMRTGFFCPSSVSAPPSFWTSSLKWSKTLAVGT